MLDLYRLLGFSMPNTEKMAACAATLLLNPTDVIGAIVRSLVCFSVLVCLLGLPSVKLSAQDQPATSNYESDPNEEGLKPLQSIKLSIAPTLKDEDGKDQAFPKDESQKYLADKPSEFHKTGFSRDWEVTSVEWAPTELAYPDLYFEDAQLERNGYAYGRLQPLMSGARFFLTIPSLPYRMGANPPTEKIYELGHFRPDDDVPPYIVKMPRSRTAGIWQGVVVTGLVFIFP
ncbi:MAG: hypothetical protein CMJ78_13820 [Planctomycetaceae bacterium]|nr:hypothetical protein [Planctomycetaceae bacterium]